MIISLARVFIDDTSKPCVIFIQRIVSFYSMTGLMRVCDWSLLSRGTLTMIYRVRSANFKFTSSFASSHFPIFSSVLTYQSITVRVKSRLSRPLKENLHHGEISFAILSESTLDCKNLRYHFMILQLSVQFAEGDRKCQIDHYVYRVIHATCTSDITFKLC